MDANLHADYPSSCRRIRDNGAGTTLTKGGSNMRPFTRRLIGAAVLAGEVNVAFASVAAVLPHAQQGRLRVMGVSSIKRSVALTDTPTLSEGGLTGYDANSWYAMFAPSATPGTVINKLSGEMVKALTLADVKSRLLSQGVEPAAGGMAEFSAYLKTEIPKWAALIKAAGIPPQ